MMGVIQNLYEKILRVASLKEDDNKSLDEAMFPPIGFLTAERKKALEKVIHISIKKIPYFEQALIHRSYLQIILPIQAFSNERLEFLGDAILSMVVGEYLFYLHSDILEGELTKMRSWLVNKKSLAYCARKLNLDEYLMVSLSAKQSLGQGNDSILADALEAIIAAIYLDSGLKNARKFIAESILAAVMNESTLMRDSNYKSILLENTQAIGRGIPRYAVIEEQGPDHDRIFTVEVSIADEVVGRGAGKNKKDAEQHAASVALEKLQIIITS